ncbi:MAG: 4Fe-4S dicluster domain-containing protein [Rectinemataceae bacterium]
MKDVFENLALFLDRLPAGYPAAPGGVELRILRKLFTAQEAAFFLHLSLLAERARVLAFRARMPEAEVTPLLDRMAQKGLISVHRERDGSSSYSVNQYVVGFMEEQVDRFDRELAELAEEYNPTFFKEGPWTRVPQIRTIPIGASISLEYAVMPYERAEEIVGAHSRFAVRNCVCRQEHALLGEGCGKPLDMCLSFDEGADASVASGRARSISRQEALDIFRRADEAGLVLQPSNSRDPIFICACCGCCCGVLRGIKQFDKPADLVANAFIVAHDADSCTVCGICLGRCQMDAISLVGGAISLNADRCIGCGLCVSSCAPGAMKLRRKAASAVIPKDTVSNYLQLASARSRLGMLRMAGMVVKSKVDRILSWG